MRTSRIYYEGELNQDLIVTLPQETSHYILHVLRLKSGAMLLLFNGKGGEYLAQITEVKKHQATVQIKEFQMRNPESPLKIHLAQAIGKGDKMDWIIQKAVELGVSQITPLLTDFCNVKLDQQRADKKSNHWHKIIISACEQSGRTQLPILNPVSYFEQWVTTQTAPLKIICHPGKGDDLKKRTTPSEVLVVIGPEGGLSDQEVLTATQHGFIGLSLGPRILRTETAALATVTVIQNTWGDLS